MRKAGENGFKCLKVIKNGIKYDTSQRIYCLSSYHKNSNNFYDFRLQ
jgi:hypothetical protein